jgi:hypothetical protein
MAPRIVRLKPLEKVIAKARQELEAMRKGKSKAGRAKIGTVISRLRSMESGIRNICKNPPDYSVRSSDYEEPRSPRRRKRKR